MIRNTIQVALSSRFIEREKKKRWKKDIEEINSRRDDSDFSKRKSLENETCRAFGSDRLFINYLINQKNSIFKRFLLQVEK